MSESTTSTANPANAASAVGSSIMAELMSTATMANDSTLYRLELDEASPRAEQPAKILLPLKPHQKAALAKALQMERTGTVVYQPPRGTDDDPDPLFYNGTENRDAPYIYKTNVGILGDVPSYGKTLTALGIIAQNLDTANGGIHADTTSVVSRLAREHGGYMRTIMDRPSDDANISRRIHSTLIVVPHGPVFCQWKKAIETQTTLRVLVLENITQIRAKTHTPAKILPAALRVPPPYPPGFSNQYPGGMEAYRAAQAAYKTACDTYSRNVYAAFAPMVATFESYDAVLIKNTTFKSFQDEYLSVSERTDYDRPHPFYGWDRIILDEAHDILGTLPFIRFGFAWLISATFTSLPRHVSGARGQRGFGTGVQGIVSHSNLYNSLVKSTQAFAEASFRLPPLTERTILCELERQLAAVHDFLSPHILERVNAGDVTGAIQALGGKADTEDNLVALVTRDLERELHNRQLHREYVLTLDLEPDVRNVRIASVDGEIRRLTDRLTALRERLTQLNEKECSICGDTFVNPVFLKCTHIHCADCLVRWLNSPAGRARGTKGCPTCREPIQLNQLVAITAAGPPNGAGPSTAAVATATTAAPASEPDRPQSKLETLLRILRANPEGRFLVFSRVEMWPIQNGLTQAGITCAELKGTTSQMMVKLDAFKNNTLRVILLNTRYAGSGIDITCATDVVLYHTMGTDAVQAIGRANRVGRTTSLRVHRLVYPHENEAPAVAPA